MTSIYPCSQYPVSVFIFHNLLILCYIFGSLVSFANPIPYWSTPKTGGGPHLERGITLLSVGSVPLYREERNLNTFKPLEVRSRGKGWFKTQLNKLVVTVPGGERRTQLWSLVLLERSVPAEASSKRSTSSSSTVRPPCRDSIITWYQILIKYKGYTLYADYT